MLIKDVTDCSTYSVRGLDDQLIAQMIKLSPGLLVRIDDLDVQLGKAVHPYLQAPCRKTLEAAIKQRGRTMVINSAYRTLAGQMLLRLHYERGRCGIVAAAKPGGSNHNGASSIDIEDQSGWRSALHANGWKWIGSFDPMHYDCTAPGIKNIQSISVKAFQCLWNIARPTDKIAEDGDFGPGTESRLRYAPAEGFPGVGIPRILKLTDPIQMGEDVGELQLALREAGINVEIADKVFGEGTDKAVKEFQAANKLLVDGIVGAGTRKLLGI